MYIEPAMRAREQSHRRSLLLAVGALIILSASPIFGHHLVAKADTLLAGRDHLGGVCLIALHLLLAPVHRVFHLLLVAGAVYAVWDRIRAWRNLRLTLGALASRTPSSEERIGLAAARAGVAQDRISVVEGLPNPAFTAGLWRPRIFIAQELQDVLDDAQLHAALAHEAAHVERRDPLRLSLLRFLACTLFYIPALRRLADDLADEAEIDADDAAASSGTALVLASAILTLAEWGTRWRATSTTKLPITFATIVGFQPFRPLQRVDLLERRIRRLAGEPTLVGTHVTRRSLAAAAAVLIAVWVSGIMMAHPLTAEALPQMHASVSHCRHPGGLAITHLFCLGFHTHPSGAPCPHAGR
ncbi:MAG: M48 family metalloprotease [Gemmatimonadota bacterium]|nr:M48 family metalloprotease [Gemmatimonadota bacterium]